MDKGWTKIYCHFHFRGITLKGTHVVHLDETRKNGSNLNCNFAEVRHPILVKLTQPQNGYHRKCHYGREPCSISLAEVWPCTLARLVFFPFILKDYSSCNIPLSCIMEIFKMSRKDSEIIRYAWYFTAFDSLMRARTSLHNSTRTSHRWHPNYGTISRTDRLKVESDFILLFKRAAVLFHEKKWTTIDNKRTLFPLRWIPYGKDGSYALENL